MQDEQQLMARLKGGDRAAFEALYARFARPLMSYFYTLCFDRVTAEDLLQETFLRVWRARQGWRPLAKVSTWIFQIAKNLWINEREKRLLRPFHAVRGGDEAAAAWERVAAPGSDGSVDRSAATRETLQALRAAVEGLSDKLREVFVMGRYQSLPYAEIAAILEIPEGTVKSRMALAEQALREQLRAHWERTR
ncbi:MAG: RNA polymerase sigma factor [Planctomycetaceae bacterium]